MSVPYRRLGQRYDDARTGLYAIGGDACGLRAVHESRKETGHLR
jgi:hypothetical protein